MSISQSDLEAFCGLLANMLSADNAVRQSAEENYQSTKDNDPNRLMLALTAVVSQHSEAHFRGHAAVLLRQSVNVERAKNFIWKKVSSETQEHVKTQLLHKLPHETNKNASHKLGDAVGKLGAYLCSGGGADSGNLWPELLPALFQMVSGSNETHMEIGLRILRMMIGEVGVDLMKDSTSVAGVLDRAMDSSNVGVRKEALLVLLEIVETLPPRLWKSVQALCPKVMAVIQAMASSGDDEELKECLQQVIAVAEEETIFFKPHLKELCQTGFRIAQARDSMDDEVRQLAFELMVTLAEKKTKLVSKNVPQFAKEAVETCMSFMLEIEEDAGWVQRTEEKDDEDVTNYEVGEEYIDRFAQSLGPEVVLPLVFAKVGEFVGKTWQHKVAAIMTISQVAEVIEDDGHTDEIVPLLLRHVTDQHPRVRYAALHALGQVSTDCQPHVQENHHEAILPVLIKAIDDPIPRVGSHACAAFVNYAEECDCDVLLPYMDNLMSKLGGRLTHPIRQVREQAITAVAVLAGVTEQHFVKYYSAVVPILKQTLQQASSKEERMLRGKAFECLSLLGMAVGRQVFLPDAVEAMSAIMSLIPQLSKEASQGGVEADDPLQSFIFESCQRICRTLKDEFVQFLPAILPSLLELCKLQGKEINHEDPDFSDEEAADLTLAMVGDKCVGLRTSQLEEMQTVLQTLNSFVEVLGPHYYDFIKITAETLLPLLEFEFDDAIKSLAGSIWADLIKAARAKNDHQLTVQLLSGMIDSSLKYMPDEADIETLDAEAKTLATCISSAGEGSVADKQVQDILMMLGKLLEESFKRREDAKKDEESGEYDDDEVDDIKVEREIDDQCRISLTEVAGALMQVAKPQFMAHGQQSFSHLIQKLIAPSNNVQDRALALYICCDYLQHLGEDSVSMWPMFMEPLLQAVLDSEAQIRQAASYGVNCACKIPQFEQAAKIAAEKLVAAISQPGAKNKDNLMAFDNAVAALGHLLEKFEGVLGGDAAQGWALWVNSLPVKNDEEEGQKSHRQLLELIKRRHAGVLGANNANVSKIVQVLASVYKKDFSNEQLDRDIAELFKDLPETMLQASCTSETAKRKIMRVVTEARTQPNQGS